MGRICHEREEFKYNPVFGFDCVCECDDKREQMKKVLGGEKRRISKCG
jgi:hypothetical protein